jgi:hypothetical protein
MAETTMQYSMVQFYNSLGYITEKPITVAAWSKA